MRRFLIPLLAGALLFAACGDDSDDTTATDTTEDGGGSDVGELAGSIEGITYVGQERTTDGNLDPLVEGSTIRLTFADGSVSANAGCNTMNGAYTLDGDTLVIDGAMAQTQMACDQALMDQDVWLSGFLASSPTLGLDGAELTVTSGGTELVLSPEDEAVPDQPLAGTAWRLDSIMSGGGADGAVSSVPSGVEAGLTIADDGTYAVQPGCNTGGGEVEVGDGSLTFQPPNLTMMACEGDAGDVEAAVLAVLDGEVVYEIAGDSLTLTAADGSGLGFVAP